MRPRISISGLTVESDGKRVLDIIQRHAAPDDLPMILAACGGRRIHIPRERLTAGNWMVRAIGMERATVLNDLLCHEGLFGNFDIPFDGRGLMATVKKVVRERMTAGILAGRSAISIALECGVTERAVRMRRAKMRELGELPEADEPGVLAATYLADRLPEDAEPAISVHVAPPRQTEIGDNLLHAAIEAAVPWHLDDPDGAERLANAGIDAKIRGLIAYVHGETVAARILAACADRQVSFSARAMERADHPFRAALDAVESRLLAIKVVASGFGDRRVSFGKAGACEAGTGWEKAA